MAIGTLTSAFPHVHKDASTLPPTVDPFSITTTTGFLPVQAPLTELPPGFAQLTALLDEMPVKKADGSPGLLATFELGQRIDGGALEDLTDHLNHLLEVDQGQLNMQVVTAAFRDYSFLASAYLLEPCWEKWNKDRSGGYGLGRSMLPRCIAGPLMKTAEILDIPPFMSYAASYALYNYKLVNAQTGPQQYLNIRLIRAFESGLDHTSSEAGFILTHVHMVQETGPLIDGALSLLSTIANRPHEHVTQAIDALETLVATMSKIESHMENMWVHSLPKDYISYRTFIFGITNQSMFPNGVVYEGQKNDQPLYFRGESGANDSIIPLLDHLLEIPMPENPLTEILRDFRSYRPKPHREFLAHVKQEAANLRVKAYCCENQATAVLYLRLLEHVRSFRWRHWLFAREYIIKRSSHPTATGGSPIVTWLPNQLTAVMELMESVYESVILKGYATTIDDMMANVTAQKMKLAKEVEKYCKERNA